MRLREASEIVEGLRDRGIPAGVWKNPQPRGQHYKFGVTVVIGHQRGLIQDPDDLEPTLRRMIQTQVSR